MDVYFTCPGIPLRCIPGYSQVIAMRLRRVALAGTTLKALHISAQGWTRSGLPWEGGPMMIPRTLKGFDKSLRRGYATLAG
jgi:hypothetical protein